MEMLVSTMTRVNFIRILVVQVKKTRNVMKKARKVIGKTCEITIKPLKLSKSSYETYPKLGGK